MLLTFDQLAPILIQQHPCKGSPSSQQWFTNKRKASELGAVKGGHRKFDMALNILHFKELSMVDQRSSRAL